MYVRHVLKVGDNLQSVEVLFVILWHEINVLLILIAHPVLQLVLLPHDGGLLSAVIIVFSLSNPANIGSNKNFFLFFPVSHIS